MGESRVELLTWINALLKLNVTKIEQLGSGVAYCQLFDSIWGDVPLNKVKFDAKHDYEFIQNFKVLQLVFEKHHVEKNIPVERLVKCRFQDNIEFCQWVKRFHDTYFPGGNYDAETRRKSSISKSRGSISSPVSQRISRQSSIRSELSGHANNTVPHRPSVRSSREGSPKSPTALHLQNNQLHQQINEQNIVIEALEKERDFYFGKLRDIEILIQQETLNGGDTPLTAKVKEILYATDQEGFFQLPDEPPLPIQNLLSNPSNASKNEAAAPSATLPSDPFSTSVPRNGIEAEQPPAPPAEVLETF